MCTGQSRCVKLINCIPLGKSFQKNAVRCHACALSENLQRSACGLRHTPHGILLNCMPALGRQIDAKYKALARILMAFEKKWYSGWLEPVESTISAHLNQPLLRDDPVSKRCAQADVLPEF